MLETVLFGTTKCKKKLMKRQRHDRVNPAIYNNLLVKRFCQTNHVPVTHNVSFVSFL